MPIVFAENFQFDTPESIVTKYPGSSRTPTPTTKVWPMAAGNLLRRETLPTAGFSRVEFYMTFSGAGGTLTTAFPFFGVSLSTPNATSLAVNGNAQTAVSPFSSIAYLHLVFEDKGGNWQGYAFADNGLKASFIAGPIVWTNFMNPVASFLPANLTSLVIAHDTAAGTRLSTVDIEEALLTATASGNWAFTDIGFVEDTNKDDPSILTPNIYSPTDESEIVYDTTEDYEHVAWTVSSRTEDQNTNSIIQVGTDSYRAIATPKSRAVSGPTVSLKFRENTSKVIAQPDFRRLSDTATSVGKLIDDYSETQWSLPATTTPFITPSFDYPCVRIPVSTTVGNVPADFGLTEATVEFYICCQTYIGSTAVYARGITVRGVACGMGRENGGPIDGQVRPFFLETFYSSRPGSSWTHMAVVFKPTNGLSGLATMWVGGAREMQNIPYTMNATNYSVVLGANGGGAAADFTGLRISNYARYDVDSASITVPTPPYPIP